MDSYIEAILAGRDPLGALLGLPDVVDFSNLHRANMQKMQKQSQNQLKTGLVKEAMQKAADVAMRNPTAGGSYNVPPAPAPAAPPQPPPAQQQPTSSISKPTGSTGQASSQMIANTKAQTAADIVSQGTSGGGQQQQG